MMELSDHKNHHRIYTIVVTYNGMLWIGKCLKSVLRSSIGTHVIVVDNLSSDGTGDYIEKHFPAVELIRSPANLGFGKGNNIALRRAVEDQADFVFLLNQDTWIEINTIEKLVAVAGRNQDFGIISPLHINVAEDGFEYKFEEYVNCWDCPGFISDLYTGNVKDIYPIKFINAAAWLISKDCLKRVGGFDPIFPHYGEDDNYLHRATYHGFKVGITSRSKIVHDSKFRTWDDIKYNKTLRLIFSIIRLNNINSSLRGNLLIYLKEQFNQLTDRIVYRRWRDLFFDLRIMSVTIRHLKRIHRSRKEARQVGAFL